MLTIRCALSTNIYVRIISVLLLVTRWAIFFYLFVAPAYNRFAMAVDCYIVAQLTLLLNVVP